MNHIMLRVIGLLHFFNAEIVCSVDKYITSPPPPLETLSTML